MSWFGETFGDSLNSLKGQITKITKEVLADDDSSNEKNEFDPKIIKELEALCESKDLEITTLRDEFDKLNRHYKSEIEVLKNENDRYKFRSANENKGVEADHDILLEAQLREMTEERNHLNTCIEELQAEHQVNLHEAILIRDNCKKELEELNAKYTSVKLKLEEFLKNESNNTAESKNLKKLLSEKNSELTLLRGENESFQLQIKAMEQEKKEFENSLQMEVANNTRLKEDIEKLTNNIKILQEENQKIENNSKSMVLENNNLQNKLDLIKQENSYEVQAQLKKLADEKEELVKEVERRSNLPQISCTDFKQRIENLFHKLNLEFEEKGKEVDEYLSLLENKLLINHEQYEAKYRKVSEVAHKLESQLEILKEKNFKLEAALKLQSEEWLEKEKKYQADIIITKKQLEEEKISSLKLLEEEKQSKIQRQNEVDYVKQLEQEINKLLQTSEAKTNEVTQLVKCKGELEKELDNLKSMTINMKEVSNETKDLQVKIQELLNKETQIENEKSDLEKKLSIKISENNLLNEMNSKLNLNITELQKQLTNRKDSEIEILKDEFSKSQCTAAELQNTCEELQKENVHLKNELENVKAQVIIREKNISELMKSNSAFQDETNKLQTKCIELQKYESEVEKWKNISLEVEMQNQEMMAKIELLEKDSLKLAESMDLQVARDTELLQLKETNSSLTETCNRLQQELESKLQAEQTCALRDSELQAKCQEQLQLITELQEEKTELSSRIQKFQEQMKIQILQNEELSQKVVQQHRRTKSAADFDSIPSSEVTSNETHNEISILKQGMLNEQAKYRELYSHFQGLQEREGNARKEFERLKAHLIEVEDHYTEEALQNEKVINDLKGKLMTAEEQLKNSSTLFTSAKIRDNQHVESLQNQVRLISVQRDEYQSKLSAAEDDVQKHKASLTSLQIVLEHFQQDKERELEGLAIKHEKQMELTKIKFKESEMEIDGLQKQLLEAKNGLRAASRLGEQLEKKTQQVSELEQTVNLLQTKLVELEERLQVSNETVNGKVDKSLIKNLLIGYILSPKADRKSQVLRILASVLDFDPEEREKMEVDASTSGWLANILHPKFGGPSTNESLSEAFIKFLENESRPQPQLKLLPENYKPTKSRSSSSAAKPHGVFSELVLPTFNSPQENESSVILKNVLKDS